MPYIPVQDRGVYISTSHTHIPVKRDGGVVPFGKNSATHRPEPVLTWPPPLADSVNFVVLSGGFTE